MHQHHTAPDDSGPAAAVPELVVIDSEPHVEEKPLAASLCRCSSEQEGGKGE